MSTIEWFLLVVVVILVPLVVAIVITLWTIEQARQRKRQNRPPTEGPVKRQAARSTEDTVVQTPAIDDPEPVRSPEDAVALETRPAPTVDDPERSRQSDVSRETS